MIGSSEGKGGEKSYRRQRKHKFYSTVTDRKRKAVEGKIQRRCVWNKSMSLFRDGVSWSGEEKRNAAIRLNPKTISLTQKYINLCESEGHKTPHILGVP